MDLKMRIAIGQFNQLSDERLKFARQIGVSGVLLNTPVLPGEKRWEFMDLLRLRTHVEDYGLRLEALENTPVGFYDRAMLGLPGRDEQIENYRATIRNMGKAGIPILGYHWMPNRVWRTSATTPGRGGAQVTSFDMDLVKDAPLTHDRVFTEEEMWKNYEYFMKAVLPVAEEAGVRLALHPDDPPVASLGGVARLFRDFEGFRRGMEIAPSPNSGLDFCVGCWSEMGPGVIEAIRFFGERGKIFYVHFRDVQGTVPRFQECFLGEGNVDVVEAMLVFKKVGFRGFMIDDHVPRMVDDTPWGHRGRALATGYMMALLEAVNKIG
ncbi:mannonate dehydratase [bacterium]|nr:mannonate dehydratase [bacterium]